MLISTVVAPMKSELVLFMVFLTVATKAKKSKAASANAEDEPTADTSANQLANDKTISDLDVSCRLRHPSTC